MMFLLLASGLITKKGQRQPLHMKTFYTLAAGKSNTTSQSPLQIPFCSFCRSLCHTKQIAKQSLYTPLRRFGGEEI
jgi:hypothetical protein